MAVPPLRLFGFRLELRFLAQVGLAFLLDDLLVAVRGRNGQPLGQQEIARIPGGYVHHLAARSQFFDIFSQYDVHEISPRLNLRRERQ